jgi:hypothetical protein
MRCIALIRENRYRQKMIRIRNEQQKQCDTKKPEISKTKNQRAKK